MLSFGILKCIKLTMSGVDTCLLYLARHIPAAKVKRELILFNVLPPARKSTREVAFTVSENRALCETKRVVVFIHHSCK